MNRISKLIAVLIVAVIIFGGCSNVPEKQDGEYKKITAEEAKNMMENNEEVIVVDVRTMEEYNEGHIANAILIPNETIMNTPPEQLTDKNAEILIYCRSGNRSKQAAEKLIDMGYTNIYDFGGIIDWSYEIVSE